MQLMQRAASSYLYDELLAWITWHFFQALTSFEGRLLWAQRMASFRAEPSGTIRGSFHR